MKTWQGVTAGALALALAASGCGDAVHRMLADPATRARLLERVAADSALASDAADHLIGSDGSRRVLFERVLASGEARQALLIEVARDPTLLDGVIQFAVQDTTMRRHILTLFKGMQMAGAK